MKLSYACICSIFGIIKSFNSNTKLAINLSGTIALDFFVTSLACHLNNSTFEVLLVMGFLWVFPVITSVAVDFSYNLNNQGVMRRIVRSRWWRRSVVIWWRRVLNWWWWGRVVVWWRRIFNWWWRRGVVVWGWG